MPTGDVAPATQYVPAAHGLAVTDALAGAVQKPAAQARHDAALTKPDPPGDAVPDAHGFVVAAPVPAGQK